MDSLNRILLNYRKSKNRLASIFGKTEPVSDPSDVASRVIEVFIKHGVQLNQIPRFFPKVSLQDLSSEQSLINKLTPELISEIANLFKVRTEWLEGVDDRIYDFYSCYKQPKKFFEQLSKYQPSLDSPLRVITSAKTFNYKSGHHQPFILVILHTVGELGEDVINRYTLDSLWDWQHEPCRIQAKAIAYIYRKLKRNNIPIFHTDYETLEKISDGIIIPTPYVNGCLSTTPSLEDYVMTPEQSVVSKESEELTSVLQYIEDHNLSDISLNKSTAEHQAEDIPHQNKQPDIDEVISERNRKHAKARYAQLDKHKKQFKQFFLNNKYENKSQAARDYFNSLSIEQRKIVVPTYYEQDHQNCLAKAVRTLSASLK